MTQLALDFASPAPDWTPCRHPRTTTSPVHQPCAEGRCCQHDEVCDDCGVKVGHESWRLDLGAKEHAKAYPEAA